MEINCSLEARLLWLTARPEIADAHRCQTIADPDGPEDGRASEGTAKSDRDSRWIERSFFSHRNWLTSELRFSDFRLRILDLDSDLDLSRCMGGRDPLARGRWRAWGSLRCQTRVDPMEIK